MTYGYLNLGNNNSIGGGSIILNTPVNLLKYSNSLDNPYWIKYLVEVTPNVIPVGSTMQANLLEAIGTGNNQYIVVYSRSNLIAGFDYTLSIKAKKDNHSWIQIVATGIVPGGLASFDLNSYANFNLDDGSVGNVGSSVLNYTSELADDGYYRFSITCRTINSIGINSSLAIVIIPDGTAGRVPAWAGAGARVYIRDCQVEPGSLTAYDSAGDNNSNLLSFPHEFDNPYWTKLRSIILPNTARSSVGTLIADQLVENTDANRHMIFRAITKDTSPIKYTSSIFAKEFTRRYLAVGFISAFYNEYMWVKANLQTQDLVLETVGGGWTNATYGIVYHGNGWYRIWITATSDSLESTYYSLQLGSNTGSLNYAGDGTSGLYVDGAKLEMGNLTDYVP